MNLAEYRLAKVQVLNGEVEDGCRRVAAVLRRGGPPNLDGAILLLLDRGKTDLLAELVSGEDVPGFVRLRIAQYLSRTEHGKMAILAMIPLTGNSSEDPEMRYFAAVWLAEQGCLDGLRSVVDDLTVPSRLWITARLELERFTDVS